MKLPPEPLSAQEVASLVGATGAYPSGIRNRALILTLYGTGIRISEALALKPKDVADGQLTIRHGKGDRARIVAMPDDTRVALEHWLTLRERYANGRHPIFCQITRGREGGAISTAYIRALLPRLGRKAGIEKRVHAHGLRHSHAVMLVRAGVDIMDLRDQLGHGNVSTTNAYLRKVAPDERVNRIRRALEGGADG